MPWQGGKSADRKDGNGIWIASLLPLDAPLYVEPFAGMLGVLLQRQPARSEIANDADGRVVNWWRAIRHTPDEFAAAIMATPSSRIEHREAWARIEADPSREGIEAAVDFTIAVLQNFPRGNLRSRSWMRRSDAAAVRSWSTGLENRFNALCERIRPVQLEHCDAVPLVADIGRNPDALIYCDPALRGDRGV